MTLSPPKSYLNQITTGDSRELIKAIPDSSIDLIFCDPPTSNSTSRRGSMPG